MPFSCIDLSLKDHSTIKQNRSRLFHATYKIKFVSYDFILLSCCLQMSDVLASSAVDRVFEPQSSQTKDYEFGICCFSAKHTALRRLVGSES